jgi:hypothetical protein
MSNVRYIHEVNVILKERNELKDRMEFLREPQISTQRRAFHAILRSAFNAFGIEKRGEGSHHGEVLPCFGGLLLRFAY